MAKFSQKQGGKEVGSAEVYAKPHTMNGEPVQPIGYQTDPNTMSASETRINQPARRVSDGNPANNDINPYGVGVMRGYGAATKGRKISGKMG